MDFLSDVPTTDIRRHALLRPLYTEITLKFIEYCRKVACRELPHISEKLGILECEQEIYWEKVAEKAIYFHSAIEAFDTLFYEVKPVFQELGIIDTFYSSLEGELVRGKLKWAPDSDIKAICIHFLEKGKLKPIRNFLLSLNSDSYDYSFLQALCIEKDLIVPLVQLSLDKEEYTFPAISLYKECTRLSHNSAEKETYQRKGYQCLWFLRMLLKGECLGVGLDPSKQPEIVQNVSCFYLIPEVIKELLRLDSFLTLEVYALFFELPNLLFIDCTPIRKLLRS